MENEHVLSGLVRKRSEIAGQIEHTQFALRQLVADLDLIDAAIKKPVTTRDIALVVMKARGLNPEDQALLVTIRKRVGACMWKLKQQRAVREIAGVGDLKEWILSV